MWNNLRTTKEAADLSRRRGFVTWLFIQVMCFFLLSLVKWFDHSKQYKTVNPLQDVWVYGRRQEQELAERTTRCRCGWSRNIGDRCSSWPSGGVHNRQHLHHVTWHLPLEGIERLHDDFFNCITQPKDVKCCSTSACKHLLHSTTYWQGDHKECKGSLEETCTERLCCWLVKLGSCPPYKHFSFGQTID